MSREEMAGLAIVFLVLLTILIEAVAPAQVRMEAPQKFEEKPPTLKIRPSERWMVEVYSEEKSLSELEYKPLLVMMDVAGCSVEVNSLGEGVAYRISIFKTSWSKYHYEVKLLRREDVNVLRLIARGVGLHLELNPSVVRYINMSCKGVVLEVALLDVETLSMEINALGCTMNLTLIYTQSAKNMISLDLAGSALLGRIEVPEGGSVLIKADASSSLVDVKAEELGTIHLASGSKVLGEAGGLEIELYCSASMLKLNRGG
ncbi:MAG: hypothetical protein DRM97_02575 [Thermoprotei archaeon]|nr:MAG: hypothetical protein DRM97_02575 [Thermoprotei archaeon]